MYYYVNPKLLVDDSVIQLNKPTEIKIDDIEEPKTVRYFYDGWFRINQIQNNDKDLILFRRGHKFVVSLKGHNVSIVELSNANRINSLNDGTWTDASSTTVTTISPNFPFQKWTYFCINLDGNQMDTYLDGKLVSSVKSKTISSNASNGTTLDFTTYASEETKLIVGNKYTTGSLARFRRESGNMDPQSVWNTYMLGPGVNDNGDENNPDYHAKIALLRHGKPRRVFNLF